MTKHLGAKVKRPKALLCYDYHNGITDEEEDIIFVTKLELFSIGTISLSITLQFVGTIKSNHTSIEVKNHSTKLSNAKFVLVEGEIINRYELVVVLEENVYLETYYKHRLRNVQIDEILTKVKVQEL
jgi:hypothetical protein